VLVLQKKTTKRATRPEMLMEAIVSGHKLVVAEVLVWVDRPARYLRDAVLAALMKHDCCDAIYQIEDKLPAKTLAAAYVAAAGAGRVDVLGRLLRPEGRLIKNYKTVCAGCSFIDAPAPCLHVVAQGLGMAARALKAAVLGGYVAVVDVILHGAAFGPATALFVAVESEAVDVVVHLLSKYDMPRPDLCAAVVLADKRVAEAAGADRHQGSAKFVLGLLRSWLKERCEPGDDAS
jgi:hypothetical protein